MRVVCLMARATHHKKKYNFSEFLYMNQQLYIESSLSQISGTLMEGSQKREQRL